MEDNLKKTIQSYDDTIEEYVEKCDPLHPKKDSDKFLEYLNDGNRILDLGCGPGRDARVFVEVGKEVVGVDLSEKMIEKAKERVSEADFKVMDIRDLDFADSFFDGVWASAIFIHIPKQEIIESLGETYRVLKPGGIFFLSLKRGEGEGLEPDKRYGGVEKYWSFFKEDEIKENLRKAGFKIISCEIQVRDPGYATNPWIYIFCKK